MKGTVRVCVCVNANACKREGLCTAVSLLDEVTTERTKKGLIWTIWGVCGRGYMSVELLLYFLISQAYMS